MKRRQAGLAAMEFTIVGASAVGLLVLCVEVGRMLFVWNTLGEATRLGARLAAVSAIGSSAAQDKVMASFGPYLPGLTASHVAVSYLDADGAVIGGAPAAGNVAFVNVAIVGYSHQLLVPTALLGAFESHVDVPAFSTTLPAESLGIDPDG